VSVAGLLAAGCGAGVPAAPPPAPKTNTSLVNMCTILTNAELTTLGVQPATRKRFNTAGVIGCRWQGKSYILSLERDNSTLAGYQAHRNDPNFINFADNRVNDRAGVHFGMDRNGLHCAQLIDGGSVSLSVSVAVPQNVNPPPVNPCAEALRIAQMIEPRLPEPAP
jgi:hypothetical protein